MANLNIPGLSSGIDTNLIIEHMTRFQQQRVDSLQARVDESVNRQTIFKEVEARLLTLQAVARPMSLSQGGVFESKRVTSSDETSIKAAAGTGAQDGTYALRVNRLAQRHMVAAQGFEATNSEITQGEITIGTGSGGSATITINTENNTLQGLANEINGADVDVTATIINEGTGTASYRLLLTADKSGTVNAITIDNKLAQDNAGAVRPNFSGIGQPVRSTSMGGVSELSTSGTYTGSDRTFTFSVVSVDGNSTAGTVGTVGTPIAPGNEIEISFTDGTTSGTFTLGATDARVPKDVADGLQVDFNNGTLVVGEEFTVDAFDSMVQQATDAQVQIGSGSGAIVVERSTNQIQDLIAGVTLDLQGVSSKEVSLTVAPDTEAAKQAIVDLVDNFNDLMDFIDEQIRFDPETGEAGPLNGNRSIISLQDTVRRTIVGVSTLIPVGINRLIDLGITVTRGRLQLNQARLDGALSGREGIEYRQIQQMFGMAGESTKEAIKFVSASEKTQDGVYGVNVTQAAEQASLTGMNTVAENTTIASTSGNNTLSVRVDNRAIDVTLNDGTYSRSAIANELETRINAQFEGSGRRVAVSVNSANKLVMTSDSYGTASEVTVDGGTARTALGFDTANIQSAQGRNVAGSFVVNGKEEEATGLGQFLKGEKTNDNTADLQVEVTLTPSQVTPGTEAEMTVTRGVAARLEMALDQLVDPVSGRLKAINDKFQRQVDSATTQMQEESKEMDEHQEGLLRQFAAMESAIAKAQASGDLISTQLQSLLVASQNNNNRTQ